MVAVPGHEIREFEHCVQFCETDEFLITSVGKYISAGLTQGDICIVLATQAHREGFDEYLKAQGLAVNAMRERGNYISLDAASTLSQIMVDGSVDQISFYRVIGEVIRQAVQSGHRVRAFGELVALLWAEGNRAGAIHLEDLWNELSRHYSFSLYCAYPMKGFDGEAYGMEFAEICQQHARVIPGESYVTLTDPDERLRVISLLQQKSNSLDIEVAERKRVEAALLESEARFRFLAEAMAVRNGSGTITMWIGSSTDIDEQKRQEERKDAFISMASHELKTPVTSLKGFAHILQNRLKKHGDEESLRFLASINKQLNRLTRLINDLLDITRVQQGRLEYDEELFELDTLVRETIENLQAGTSTHRLVFEESQAARVRGDKDRIGQVLTNLITNAVKYSPTAERVIIRLINDGESAIVSVQDFGIGIAPKHQARIFERFYQVTDEEEKTYPGLGVGLYLSSEIVKRHRGRIRVESEKGAGSTFSFSLPIATAD